MKNKVVRISCLLALGVLAIESPALAQSGERGFVQGLVGVTFGTETSSVVGGGVGVNVTPTLQIIGEFGRMQNVLPKSLQNDLDDAAAQLEYLYDVSVTMDAKVPAFYGMGGVRINVPTSSKMRPFVTGTVGFASLNMTVDARVAGQDISDVVMNEVGELSETDALLSVGGGVNIEMLPAMSIDVGYRFIRIFTGDPAANVSSLFAGLSYRF